MESTYPHLLDRPRVLDGLKSRKALNIPEVNEVRHLYHNNANETVQN